MEIGRDVAVKVLPSTFSTDKDRRRFQALEVLRTMLRAVMASGFW
jgi:hypothetical protein